MTIDVRPTPGSIERAGLRLYEDDKQISGASFDFLRWCERSRSKKPRDLLRMIEHMQDMRERKRL